MRNRPDTVTKDTADTAELRSTKGNATGRIALPGLAVTA
jgi:hypothetical protein